MGLNNRPQVAGTKTMLRHVADQNDSVEFLEAHGYLGSTVTRTGTSAPVAINQTARSPPGSFTGEH